MSYLLQRTLRGSWQLALVQCLCFAPLLVPAIATAGLNVPSGTYGVDKTHSYITFSYSHMGFSTPHVGFNDFDIALTLDADNPEKSQVRVTIDAASIDSRVAEFDEHLVGADYFDVANHPTIIFESTQIEMQDELQAKITGNLTIKGKTQSIVLEMTLNKAANHPMLKVPTIGVSGNAAFKRSKLGLGKYVPAVGDDVSLFITAEMPLKK